MTAIKFKLGIHMNSGLMYSVYQNLGQEAITLRVTSLDRFYNFATNEKFLSYFSLEL